MINKKYIFILILIILIILILIILINYKDFQTQENYGGIIRNINSIEDCADIASSLYDVGAFASAPSDKNCYPSKTSLTRPPIQIHPYHNDFKQSDIICNKTLYVKNSEMNFDQILIGNRLYQCYNNNSKLDDDYDTYYFQKNKKKQLITYQDIAKLPITKHNFFKIDWPLNKDELNDIKILKNDNSIKSIDWIPKIPREYKEEKLQYPYEYKYPKLGCIN
jgi:hypothetical protein